MRAEVITNPMQPIRVWSALVAVFRTVRARLAAVRPARRLRVCESVPLGEKRFLAVVQFEHNRFLIGCAANSVVLLTRLDEENGASFPEALAVAERGHA
jgi:flagellar biogenesis protein FliO